MYSKFFDNKGPLPHHIHHNDHYASFVGERGKPEMYFSPLSTIITAESSHSPFFGFNPNADQSIEEGYLNEWICYRSQVAGASRTTIMPGKSILLKEKVAYGLICPLPI